MERRREDKKKEKEERKKTKRKEKERKKKEGKEKREKQIKKEGKINRRKKIRREKKKKKTTLDCCIILTCGSQSVFLPHLPNAPFAIARVGDEKSYLPIPAHWCFGHCKNKAMVMQRQLAFVM